MAQVIKSVDCPNERYDAGKVIFKENTASDSFYIVKSGQVDVFRNFGKPDQLLLATIPAGRVLGEISGIDGGLRSATAVAKGEVHLVKVSSKTLKWQLKQCPSWFSAVVLDIVERLRATDDLLTRSGTSSAHNAVSSMKETHSAE
jgi:CRP-like cAMP-binding protein